MVTFTAFTSLGTRPEADKLSDAMEGLLPEPFSVGVFDVDDGSGRWEVGGYFTQAPDAASLSLIAAAFGAQAFVVSEVPETDWVAHVHRELSPVQAGRFFVYGSHDADKVPEGSVALLIEAALAFGTGHHGTTLGCLRALERVVADGFSARSVADIGCGTAVLAMAAAHCYEGRIIASDIDGVAVDVARTNVAANGLGDRVECFEAAGFDHDELTKAPYDLIFANILKGPLIELAPSIKQASAPSGRVILSGILNSQAAQIVSVYTEIGFKLLFCEEIGEWSTLTLKRISG